MCLLCTGFCNLFLVVVICWTSSPTKEIWSHFVQFGRDRQSHGLLDIISNILLNWGKKKIPTFNDNSKYIKKPNIFKVRSLPWQYSAGLWRRVYQKCRQNKKKLPGRRNSKHFIYYCKLILDYVLYGFIWNHSNRIINVLQENVYELVHLTYNLSG